MNISKIEKPLWDGAIKDMLSVYSKSFGIELEEMVDGGELPYEWWKYVDDKKNVLGLGWIHFRENLSGETEGEISLCVRPNAVGKSIGNDLLLFLEKEIKKRGIVVTSVVVKKSNPTYSYVVNWFKKRQYDPEEFTTTIYMTKRNEMDSQM